MVILNDGSHKFCNVCGHSLIALTKPIASELAFAPSKTSQPSAEPPPVESNVDAADLRTAAVAEVAAANPPFAKLVIVSLCSALAASVVAFIVADDIAREEWNSVLAGIFATTALLFSMNAVVKNAARLREIGDPGVRVHRKKLLRRLMFFGVVFVGVAALIGNRIGASGSETARLFSDIDQMVLLGDRISSARNEAPRTVDAQVEMYKRIETDVEELTSVLQRLQSEYVVYDRKFPAQHSDIAKALDSVRIGIARMDLLREQIAIAKVIASQDADTGIATWEARIEPILEREDSLDSAKQ